MTPTNPQARTSRQEPPMTPHTTCPLLWDGTRFRPIDTLPDLAEWAETPPGRTHG